MTAPRLPMIRNPAYRPGPAVVLAAITRIRLRAGPLPVNRAPRVLALAAALSCAWLAACTGVAPDGATPAFTLQLLHVSDIDGAGDAPARVAPFSAILEALRREFPERTLVLSSGDNSVPGPRYAAAADAAMAGVPGVGVPGPGRADVAWLNAMGLHASALGNHDLDGGTAEFAARIRPQATDRHTYPGARFPYLAANLDFGSDADLAPLAVAAGRPVGAIPGRLAASATVTLGGERIGIVGATTPWLAAITDTGGITVMPADGDDLAALAARIQGAVDALTARGVDKVVLLAHMQVLDVERRLAGLLRGVDVIVAGGSNTLLADADDRLHPGDRAAATYPLRLTSAAGEPVLLVNTDGDYKYLGRLVVGFDQRGVVLPDSVEPRQSGVYAVDAAMVAALGGAEKPALRRVVDALRAVLAAREGNVFGRSVVYLDGRRERVRTQETNLGDLAADANLWLARRHDPTVVAALQNGGGIRDAIGYFAYPPGATRGSELAFFPPAANAAAGKPAGAVSQFDIESALRFGNGLSLVTVSARQLHDVLEHAVAAVTDQEGRFPQVAGLRFSFDPGRPARVVDAAGTRLRAGERVRSLALVDSRGRVTDVLLRDGAPVGDPERPVRLVTLDFLAAGGDGYPLPGSATERVDLAALGAAGGFDPGRAGFAAAGTEQDALAEYLAAHHAQHPFDRPETGPAGDQRIQNLSVRADTVLPAAWRAAPAPAGGAPQPPPAAGAN